MHARTRDVVYVVGLTERIIATASSAAFLARSCESRHAYGMRIGEAVAAARWSTVRVFGVKRASERASIGSSADRLVKGMGAFPTAVELQWQRDERQAMLASVRNT